MNVRRVSHSEVAVLALEQALEPIVDLLLDLGVPSSRAEDVLRDVFVRTAHKKLSRQLAKVSNSQVALRCGLYREEVRKRLAKPSAKKQRKNSEQHKLSQLIVGWHEDPDFLSSAGKPRALAYEGPRSFGTLVSRYAAFMYPAVVRAELEQAGVIIPAHGQRLKVVSREYRGAKQDPNRLSELGARARDALTTLVDDAVDKDDHPIVLQAMGFNVDPRYVPLLHSAIRSRAEIFMRLLDQELNHESRRAGSHEDGVRLGVMLLGVQSGSASAITPVNPASRVPGNRSATRRRQMASRTRGGRL